MGSHSCHITSHLCAMAFGVDDPYMVRILSSMERAELDDGVDVTDQVPRGPLHRAGAPRVGRGVCTLLLCLVVASGCGDEADAPRGATVEVQDSSGVELVSDPQGERFLGLEEVLRVGVLEGDPALQFDRIRSVALDGSDGVWVVDSHESVRHYSGSGRYLGSVGSEGSGPGEAQGYGHVWTGDDSIIVRGYPGVLQRFQFDGTLMESTTSSVMRDKSLEILPQGVVGG